MLKNEDTPTLARGLIRKNGANLINEKESEEITADVANEDIDDNVVEDADYKPVKLINCVTAETESCKNAALPVKSKNQPVANAGPALKKNDLPKQRSQVDLAGKKNALKQKKQISKVDLALSAQHVDNQNKNYSHAWSNNAPVWKASPAVKKCLADTEHGRVGSYTCWGSVTAERRAALKKEIYHYIGMSQAERKKWLDPLMKTRLSNGKPYKALKGQWEVLAAQDIKKCSLLGHYAGVVHNQESYDRIRIPSHITDSYAVVMANGYILSAFGQGNVCSLINAHSDYSSSARNAPKPNVQYTYHRDRNGRQYVIMISIRKINKGDILWADYGADYWIDC